MLSSKNILTAKLNSIFFGTMILLSFLVFTNTAKAQAPGATCLVATAIGGTGNVPGCTGAVTMTDFTVEGTTPSIAGCISGGIFRREGWYSFTIGAPTAITVTGTSTTGSSNLLIQVISGTCAAEVQVACINNTTGPGAQTETGSLGVLAAGTYFVRCVNLGAAANMAMSNLCVNITPANDDCANASTLTPLAASAPCGGVAGTTLGASPQAAIPATCTAANTNNDDVWYTFTTTSTTHVITVTPTATMDPVFQVYSSNPCGGAGTSIACINAVGAGTAETTTLTGLALGGTYWVRVYDAGTGIPSSSLFTICVQTPPANDDCAGSVLLTTNPTCITTAGNVNVGTNSGIASCGGTPDEDVWYRFVATCTSQSISVTGSASFDPCFELFSGACGGLTSILCNATGGNTGLTVTSNVTGLTIGTTYYVRVYDFAVGYPATTTFTICVVNAPPANDDCINAIALTAPSTVCNTTNGDVCGATQSLVGCSGTADDDIWYKFTASQAIHIITVQGNGTFDAVFELFGSCGGASLGCVNATGAGGLETASFSGLTNGAVYYVRVYDAGAGFPSNTTFTICVTSPPLNDDCPGITIPVSGTQAAPSYCTASTTGALAGASASGYAATCGGTPNDDVWYNFVATSNSHIITVVPCAGSDIVIQAYKNACGTGLNLGCANALGAGGTERLTVSGLVVGTTYWVRVYDFTGSSNCTFTICVTTPPQNDPCSSPVNLTPSTSCVATNGTLAGSTNSGIAVGAGACIGTVPNNDVWYTFSAGAASQTITVVGSAGLNVVYELFSSNPCGGAGTSLGCVNSTGVNGTETFNFTGLTAGATYWVRVYDATGAPSTYTFTICVITPVNNTCATAISVVCGNSYSGNSNVGLVNAPATCTSNAGINSGVWFVFAGTGQNVTASLCGGVSYDSQIYIYSSTGPCTGLTCIAGNDDLNGLCAANGLASAATFGTVVGVNYYIYVTSYAGSTGPYTLAISCVAPPANDQCTGAIHTYCGASTQTYSGNTANASGINDLTNCSGASGTNAQYPRALWYSYTGDGSTVTFSLCAAGGGAAAFSGANQTILAVWQTTPNGTYCSGTFNCIAGAIGNCAGQAQVSVATTAYADYFIEVYGYYFPAFSGSSTGVFTLGVSTPACQTIILPIELLRFTGDAYGKKNLLKWTTATETNNDYFTIEKSADGQSFTQLTRISGAGNSTHNIDYSTYDNDPINGITYYRLKQVDYNGAFTYSDVVPVLNTLDEVSITNVRPNPTTNDVSFDFYAGIKGNVHIEIMDYLGRKVSDETQSVSDGNVVINAKMNALEKGIYSLKVTFDQTGYSTITKVVKN
jgi:Secretion system C-terminal sorting domain